MTTPQSVVEQLNNQYTTQAIRDQLRSLRNLALLSQDDDEKHIELEEKIDELACLFSVGLLGLLKELQDSGHSGMLPHLEVYADGSGWVRNTFDEVVASFNNLDEAAHKIRKLTTGEDIEE